MVVVIIHSDLSGAIVMVQVPLVHVLWVLIRIKLVNRPVPRVRSVASRLSPVRQCVRNVVQADLPPRLAPLNAVSARVGNLPPILAVSRVNFVRMVGLQGMIRAPHRVIRAQSVRSVRLEPVSPR